MKFTTTNGLYTYDSDAVDAMSKVLDKLMGPPLAVVPFNWNEKKESK